MLTASATSVRVWTAAQFAERFGKPYAAGRHIIVFANGDGSATGVHIEGCTYLNGDIYAVFDKTVAGPVRVNWVVMEVA